MTSENWKQRARPARRQVVPVQIREQLLADRFPRRDERQSASRQDMINLRPARAKQMMRPLRLVCSLLYRCRMWVALCRCLLQSLQRGGPPLLILRVVGGTRLRQSRTTCLVLANAVSENTRTPLISAQFTSSDLSTFPSYLSVAKRASRPILHSQVLEAMRILTTGGVGKSFGCGGPRAVPGSS